MVMIHGMFQSRRKVSVYDSDLGPFTDEQLKAMEKHLKYEGARSERLEPFIEGCPSKSFEDLPMSTRQLVLAELKKETIMGDRMLVVDVKYMRRILVSIYFPESPRHLKHTLSVYRKLYPKLYQFLRTMPAHLC
jgi:hypothetical protein